MLSQGVWDDEHSWLVALQADVWRIPSLQVNVSPTDLPDILVPSPSPTPR